MTYPRTEVVAWTRPADEPAILTTLESEARKRIRLADGEKIINIGTPFRTDMPSEVNGRWVDPKAEGVWICSTAITIARESPDPEGSD